MYFLSLLKAKDSPTFLLVFVLLFPYFLSRGWNSTPTKNNDVFLDFSLEMFFSKIWSFSYTFLFPVLRKKQRLNLRILFPTDIKTFTVGHLSWWWQVVDGSAFGWIFSVVFSFVPCLWLPSFFLRMLVRIYYRAILISSPDFFSHLGETLIKSGAIRWNPFWPLIWFKEEYDSCPFLTMVFSIHNSEKLIKFYFDLVSWELYSPSWNGYLFWRIQLAWFPDRIS